MSGTRTLFGTGGAVPSSFAGGAKTLGGSPSALVGTATPCLGVWVGAQTAATNAARVLLGDSSNQNMPLEPDDAKGYFIWIDDASKIYVSGTSGDIVQYRILV